MSSSFKGIISIIISAFFFFPWVWSGILHVRLSAVVLLLIGIVASVIAIFIALQARKDGSRVLGMAGITLGTISVVLSLVNLIAVIGGNAR